MRYATRSGLLIVAITVNLGLYWLMETMIGRPASNALDVVETNSIDFVRTPIEEQTRTKDRRRPPPPKPQQAERPRSRIDTEFDQTVTELPMDMAQMNVASILGAGGGGVAIGARMVDGTPGANGPEVLDMNALTPISMLPPEYPRRALAQGIEGWVAVMFRVDEAGQARDPVILDSRPDEVFERAAIAAVERWRFRPMRRGPDDPPVYVQTRISFVRDTAESG